MKKLFILLLIFFLPSTVFATVLSLHHKVIFVRNFSDVSIEVGYPLGVESDSEVLKIIAAEPNLIKVNGRDLVLHVNHAYLYPTGPGTNNYEFWKLSGEYKGERFFIFGYSIDVGGDTWLERNSIIIDLLKILLLIPMFVFLFVFFRSYMR